MIDSVLVHVCCVHCSAYTLSFWQDQGYRVSAFWYNPNIHPAQEHQQRLNAAAVLLEQQSINLSLYPDYEPSEFFNSVKNSGPGRCADCFRLRLEKTAGEALRLGFKAFSSSLLISPQQQHEELMSIGDEIAGKTGLVFLYSDLRRRYSDSRVITKRMNLYRQDYCGCEYSRQEKQNRF
ncbi:MAG: epoxyqueuosine reductase QueH [Dehalococcoidaceae bacterium]|nr:epoxyqueuosine reductase QueH [Dehalococcoidaceae bacterium]